MKNILTIIFVLAVTNMLYSQNTMYIHQTGGTVANYALSSVDSITFGTSQGTVTDIDGNIYETVKICEQIWMKQNLKVTHYNNGVVIPKVTDATSWSNLSTGARSYYNNDSATYKSGYGCLYNWFTANAGNLCPSGWHVPSDTEWTALENCLGGNLVAGGKMKEAGTTHWTTPNDGATNSSGFTGLPGGYRDSNGSYSTVYDKGCWWSATGSSSSYGWFRSLYFNTTGVSRGSLSKNFGYYIRCLKD
jgi:uncharacterized protein (TIGR02145 family)